LIFEQVASGGCQSYLMGCEETSAAALIDPEITHVDRYLALAARDGLRIRYLVDTHTHADHFSATRQLARRLSVPVAMHRASPAPFVDLRLDDGEMLAIGKLRLQVLYTPGHTRDSMSLLVDDRIFTGDTLLIEGCGRTDFQSGDAGSLYDSVHERLFALPDDTRVWPAHDYRGNTVSTIGHERRHNPRLANRDRASFIELMANLQLPKPKLIDVAVPANRQLGIPHGA